MVWFFLLTGENLVLAQAELETVINALGISGWLINSFEKRVVYLKFEDEETQKFTQQIEQVHQIVERLCLTHFSAFQFFSMEFSGKKDPVKLLRNLKAGINRKLANYAIPNGQSFAVRAERIGKANEIPFPGIKLEREIGGIFHSKFQNIRVDLSNPDVLIKIVVSKRGIWIGVPVIACKRKEIMSRKASKRPFFHPSAMEPILAHAMMNLAITNVNATILDPFSGTGSFLIEGAVQGHMVIGTDRNKAMIFGSKRNLAKFHQRSKGEILLGDARYLPFKTNSFAAIVTDPPYGTAASTEGEQLNILFEKFLIEAKRVLKIGGRLVISGPSYLSLVEMGKQAALSFVNKFSSYVHRSLTRQIIVFEKVKKISEKNS
ncbi:MAG: methyltransferase domain-containing protein [Promethearchaeota archaeon]